MKWLKGCVWALVGAASLAIVLAVGACGVMLWGVSDAIDSSNATSTATARYAPTRTACLATLADQQKGRTAISFDDAVATCEALHPKP